MPKPFATVVVSMSALALTGCAAFSWLPFVHGGRGEDTLVPRASRMSDSQRRNMIETALAAPDRPSLDIERDESRRTAQVLALSRVGLGERVLDIGAAGGYMTWLYAALVGPTGAVTAQDPQAWLERSPAIRSQMAALTGSHPNVTYEVRSFDAIEGEPASYDLAAMTLIYHETVLSGADRAEMNRRIFQLLKPGGRYLVTDHAALPGSGLRGVELHRIDAELVKLEVEAAGFALAEQSTALVNPADNMTLNIFDPQIRGRTSQFALLFVKPE